MVIMSDDPGVEECEEIQLELGLAIRGECGFVNNKAMTTMTSSDCSSTSSSLHFRTADAGVQKKRADIADYLHYSTHHAYNSHVAVGWPPVSRRAFKIDMGNVAKLPTMMKSFDSVFRTVSKCTTSNLLQSSHKKDGGGGGMVSPYVKVNMDGNPIGRKVDLTSMDSYESLALKLEDMFFNSQPLTTSLVLGADPEKKNATDTREPVSKLSSEFVLTFEDEEGDWMLVGDVPWRMFCDSVKRLRIMRISR